MLERLPGESLAGDGASAESSIEGERERVERVLLRAVLGWVADTAPGRVARLAFARAREGQPLIWDVVAERSDGVHYQCAVVLVSDHFAVCLGEPVFLPCWAESFLTREHDAPRRPMGEA